MDAMDETPHGLQREEFLRLLHEMATTKPSTLKVLVTSQNEPDFEDAFRWELGWLSVGLGRSRVDADIRQFVQHEISIASKFANLPQIDKERIESYLVQEANGVYVSLDSY